MNTRVSTFTLNHRSVHHYNIIQQSPTQVIIRPTIFQVITRSRWNDFKWVSANFTAEACQQTATKYLNTLTTLPVKNRCNIKHCIWHIWWSKQIYKAAGVATNDSKPLPTCVLRRHWKKHSPLMFNYDSWSCQQTWNTRHTVHHHKTWLRKGFMSHSVQNRSFWRRSSQPISKNTQNAIS